jgi:hypothetical protein
VLYGNPETTSGGQALKFYSSIRLDIRAKEKISEPGKTDPVGNRVKVTVKKNKVSPNTGHSPGGTRCNWLVHAACTGLGRRAVQSAKQPTSLCCWPVHTSCAENVAHPPSSWCPTQYHVN